MEILELNYKISELKNLPDGFISKLHMQKNKTVRLKKDNRNYSY